MESSKFICSQCVYEDFLSEQIKEDGIIQHCEICGSKRACYSLEMIVEIVAKAFGSHFKVGDEIPRSYPDQDNPRWEQLGEPFEEIIREIFEADEKVIEAVISDIKTAYGDDLSKGSHNSLEEDRFVKRDIKDTAFQNKWNEFCHKIKHSTRFFSNDLVEFLNEIFDGIEQYQTAEDGRFVCCTITPDDKYSTLYRARQADSRQEKEEILRDPYGQLSAPPSKSTKAGRINPAGIPVLYASLLHEKTCIKEIRLPVGSEAIIATFKLLEPMNVLDLTACRELYDDSSILDLEHYRILQQKAFLRRLENEFSKPVLPKETDIEYIPTQAIAEYLAKIRKLDGVIYKSSQGNDNEKNIAIFNHFIRIKTPEIAFQSIELFDVMEDTSLRTVMYRLKEEDKNVKDEESSPFFLPHDLEFVDYHPIVPSGPPTFELLLDKIKIVRIKAVEVEKIDWNITYQDESYLHKYFGMKKR